MDHEAVLQQIVAWGRQEDNIRVVVLTGSVARGEGAFDELSDLDIELYAGDPFPLLDDTTWYEQFGEVLVVEALENPGWHPTRLVYYADGKIDFMIGTVRALMGDGVSHDRPFRVLIDKDDFQRSLCRNPPRREGPPQADEFLRCVHGFHAAAIMWAKCLVRDDPWSAKVRDWDSKRRLLQMLEWDQKARKGWDLDAWRHGAHLREWADPELVTRIGACWSGLARAESVQALFESVSLFETLSTRTAHALAIEPFDGSAVRRRIERLLETENPGRDVDATV